MKHKINSFITLCLLLAGTIVAVSVSATPVQAAAIDECTPVVVNQETGEQTSVGTAKQGDCAKATSFTFGSCGSTDVGINCLVTEVLSFFSILVGVAVLGGVIFGGITYSTAGGNPAKVKKGATIIGSALGGLVLYLLMFAIINFLLPSGTLT